MPFPLLPQGYSMRNKSYPSFLRLPSFLPFPSFLRKQESKDIADRGSCFRRNDGNRRLCLMRLPARRLAQTLAPVLVPVFAVVLLTLVAACSSAAPPEPLPIATKVPTTQPTAPAVPTDIPAATQASVPEPASNPSNPPTGSDEINPILATKILDVGAQRVSFLLSGKKALIKAPEATVTSTYLGDSQGAANTINTIGETTGETRQATYHAWPYGIRGAYSTEMTFDRPGTWRLDIAVDDGEIAGTTHLELEVVEQSPVPGLGSRPPLSRTKTLADVDGVERLTTDYTPDEDLYRLSVAAAIESPRPAVIAFASPAFCTSPTCGPQVDTVSELKEAYQGRADFVHVEIYDRPEEIQGDLSRAEVADAVKEWGFTDLPEWFNESWVFILNDQGIVEQRFEGYATLTELEAVLVQVLGEG